VFLTTDLKLGQLTFLSSEKISFTFLPRPPLGASFAFLVFLPLLFLVLSFSCYLVLFLVSTLASVAGTSGSTTSISSVATGFISSVLGALTILLFFFFAITYHLPHNVFDKDSDIQKRYKRYLILTG